MEKTAAHHHQADAPRLEPDLDQARTFLELLDPDTEQFSYQAFDDSPLKRGNLAKILHGSLDEQAARLSAMQSNGAGVFITVNETDLRGRTAKNITRVRAVFVDLDGSPLQPVLRCSLEPHVIVESSPGRWHAYWMVDGLELDQFAAVQKSISARFNGDKAVHDLPRVMRLPGFIHQKGAPFRTTITHLSDRMPYSSEQILAEFPPVKVNGAATDTGEDHPSALTPEILDELRKALEGDTHNGWHTAMLKLVGRLVHDGASDWFIKDWALQYRWPGYSAEQTVKDIDVMISGARAKGYHQAQAQGRPEIDVVGGNFARNVHSAIAALQQAGVPVYDRGGMLVRPVEQVAGADGDGIRRAVGSIILAPVSPDWIRVTLGQVAAWRKFDGRTEKWKPTDPPPDVARTVVTAPDLGRWPYLRAIVRHPVLLPSGRRLTAQGYDAETGLLVDAPGDWPPLPDRPTREDAQAALEVLQHLLRYFPWKTDADCAVALSLILTALNSAILDAVPGHAVDAPAAGSGKSTLMDGASFIAYGTKAAVLDYGKDPEEAAKRLDSALLAGDAILHIDNVEAPLEGAALCQTITQAARRMRLLGSNSMVTVPCNILITATGNNLTLRGDIVRRMLVCRLDAELERPEERDIPQDLLAEVAEQRGQLVRCAQTITAAYIHAGRPHLGLKPIGSFGDWSRMVREPLVWAGAADPVTTITRARSDDPDLQNLGAVLSAWHDAAGSDAMTVASLIGLAEARAENAAAELKEALSLVALRGGKIDGNRLGHWLKRNRDCRIGTLTLLRRLGVGHSGGATWMVDAR